MKDRSWLSTPTYHEWSQTWSLNCRPLPEMRMSVIGLSRREVYRKAILQRRHFIGMRLAARLTK